MFTAASTTFTAMTTTGTDKTWIAIGIRTVLSGRTYSSRREAIQREIIEPIAAGDIDNVDDEYDVEALADDVLTDYNLGFQCRVTDEDFWMLVEAHRRG